MDWRLVDEGAIGRGEKIREDYGLDPTQISRYGFLNANRHAKPASIIRVALALARAKYLNVVSKSLVNVALKEYFEWNLRYVYEIWEDLLRGPTPIPLGLKEEYGDIIRVIREYQDKDPSGVSIKVIISELKENPYILKKRLEECRAHGLIYETSYGRYKLIPQLE